MDAYGAMAGKAVEGVAGLLGKGKEAMSGVMGGMDKAMNPGDYMEAQMPAGIAGPGQKVVDPNKKAGKQAAADKSMKDMSSAISMANAAGTPGQSYVSMGGLLGMGQNQMGNAQQNAQQLAGNSKAQIYQKMLFDQMMRGG